MCLITEKKEPKFRIFSVVQFEKNLKTGESLNFNEDNIFNGLDHKSIKRYSWIKHNLDIYTDDEQLEDEKKPIDEQIGIKSGNPKPTHYHIVFECSPALPISTICDWFGVPPQVIKCPKGRGAFLDCVQYLTHESNKEQSKGKTLYPDEYVNSNFDFRQELSDKQDNRLKYGVDLNPKDRMLFDVRYLGKSLKQCKNENKVLYLQLEEQLYKKRLRYIESLEVPARRFNFYISGKSGYGKDVLSRALARLLYPDLEDDEIFFEVGGDNVTFEGYDGQPVIIWSERRALTLLNDFKGRENLFKVFDPNPHNGKLNIKYGSIKLVNTINIVNSVQDYNEFLKGLAGEYKDFKAEDVNQSYRRFPCIIPLHAEDFDILLNAYCFGKSLNPQEYDVFKSVNGNFGVVRSICQGNEELARKYENKMLSDIDKPVNEFLENKPSHSIEEIEDRLKDFGKTKQQLEEEKRIQELGLFALCDDKTNS